LITAFINYHTHSNFKVIDVSLPLPSINKCSIDISNGVVICYSYGLRWLQNKGEVEWVNFTFMHHIRFCCNSENG